MLVRVCLAFVFHLHDRRPGARCQILGDQEAIHSIARQSVAKGQSVVRLKLKNPDTQYIGDK